MKLLTEEEEEGGRATKLSYFETVEFQNHKILKSLNLNS